MKKRWIAEVNKNSWILAEVLSDKRKDTRVIINQIKKMYLPGERDQDTPEKLLELIKKEKINAKNLKISLSCAGVVFRIVSVPKMGINKLDQFIYDEFEQCFSFDLTDYIIDYRIIRRFKNLGQERISILLAAVPKHEVEEATAIWKSAALHRVQ
jgi:type IV pilus assembly protein PilM